MSIYNMVNVIKIINNGNEYELGNSGGGDGLLQLVEYDSFSQTINISNSDDKYEIIKSYTFDKDYPSGVKVVLSSLNFNYSSSTSCQLRIYLNGTELAHRYAYGSGSFVSINSISSGDVLEVKGQTGVYRSSGRYYTYTLSIDNPNTPSWYNWSTKPTPSAFLLIEDGDGNKYGTELYSIT